MHPAKESLPSRESGLKSGYYDGRIIWDVTAEPKLKNESIPPITPNTPPISEEPAGAARTAAIPHM